MIELKQRVKMEVVESATMQHELNQVCLSESDAALEMLNERLKAECAAKAEVLQ